MTDDTDDGFPAGSNRPPNNLDAEDLATMSLTDIYNWYGQGILGPQAGLEQRVECGKWYVMGQLHAARADAWRRATLYPYDLAAANPAVKEALDRYRQRLHEAHKARAQEVMDYLLKADAERRERWRQQDEEQTLAEFLKSSSSSSREKQ